MISGNISDSAKRREASGWAAPGAGAGEGGDRLFSAQGVTLNELCRSAALSLAPLATAD
jgi:hypothetical protein